MTLIKFVKLKKQPEYTFSIIFSHPLHFALLDFAFSTLKSFKPIVVTSDLRFLPFFLVPDSAEAAEGLAKK